MCIPIGYCPLAIAYFLLPITNYRLLPACQLSQAGTTQMPIMGTFAEEIGVIEVTA